MTKEERAKLLYQPKNGYDRLTAQEEQEMNAYCEDYKAFLNAGKTEREVVTEAIRRAEAQGFRPFDREKPLKAGDKITLTCYATSTPTAGKPYGISIYGDPAGTALASVNSTLKNTEEALTITVPAALEGATSFYLFRNVGYSVYFTGVTVKRSATAADGIKAAAKGDSDAVYDLSGRKVTNIAKGQLYIKSGKTFIAQ